jgi:hypothetical protein
MSPQELEVGRAYFRVTYADPSLTVPGVEPMIFIGVNALRSDIGVPGPVYTFQDTVSYSRFGSAAAYKGPANLSDEGARIHSFTTAELSELVDLAGAAEALNDAVERARWQER